MFLDALSGQRTTRPLSLHQHVAPLPHLGKRVKKNPRPSFPLISDLWFFDKGIFHKAQAVRHDAQALSERCGGNGPPRAVDIAQAERRTGGIQIVGLGLQVSEIFSYYKQSTRAQWFCFSFTGATKLCLRISGYSGLENQQKKSGSAR